MAITRKELNCQNACAQHKHSATAYKECMDSCRYGAGTGTVSLQTRQSLGTMVSPSSFTGIKDISDPQSNIGWRAGNYSSFYGDCDCDKATCCNDNMPTNTQVNKQYGMENLVKVNPCPGFHYFSYNPEIEELIAGEMERGSTREEAVEKLTDLGYITEKETKGGKALSTVKTVFDWVLDRFIPKKEEGDKGDGKDEDEKEDKGVPTWVIVGGLVGLLGIGGYLIYRTTTK